MKKMKVYQAWIILISSLPRGIGAFIITVAGLSVGLPLAIFVVGIPLLAGMIIGCERILNMDRKLLAEMDHREAASTPQPEGANFGDFAKDERLRNWRGWASILGNKQSYWNLVYGLFQFPVSILAFVFAIIIPAVGIGLTLSPLAELVSTRYFSFDLFAKDWFMNWLFPEWSSFQRSWFNAGLGSILLLSMPFLMRKLVGYYAAWIRWISGTGTINNVIQVKEA